MTDADEDMMLAVADGPAYYAVRDDEGRVIGHLELPAAGHAVPAEEFEHMKHEFMQLRNQVVRLQTQMKLLESRLGRR